MGKGICIGVICATLAGAAHLRAQAVHHFTHIDTIIERGDTMTWTHTDTLQRPMRQDTIVVVFGPDTVVQLRPGPSDTLSPFLAKHMRNVLRFAREADELRKTFGNRIQ